MKLILEKSDVFGAAASTLCVIHCLATPFIFIAQTASIHNDGASPFWWKNLDFIFLIISYFAVARSSKNTSRSYMKPLLWGNWTVLFLLILNEKYQFVLLAETVTYITALSLAALHIFNLKYCQCKNNKCCVNNEK